MKTDIHFWSYLAQFFSEWEMFQTKFVEKIKTHILCSVTFFRKSCRLLDNVEKYCRTRQATDDNMAHPHWKAGYLRIQTNSQNITIAFPLQQWLDERAAMLPYKYIACLLKHYYRMNFLLHLVPEMVGFEFRSRCGWGQWFATVVGSWLTATDQGRKRARSGDSDGRCLHPYNLRVEHRHSATITQPKSSWRTPSSANTYSLNRRTQTQINYTLGVSKKTQLDIKCIV